jgi:imidazoleglycerol-phosphate dehydratase/histidinol-phosphatase
MKSIEQRKFIFIDRDGTLICEPEDHQIDSLDKLVLMPNVIPALLKLRKAGYSLIIVTNQDGIGTPGFPEANFLLAHNYMLHIFSSQGIEFESVRVCPHYEQDGCVCRKPKMGLFTDLLINQSIDRDRSYVIGDRESDMKLADNLGIKGMQFGSEGYQSWLAIADDIINQKRKSAMTRKTKETEISVSINLDKPYPISIHSGIRFLDHMLEQFAKHSGISLTLQAKGDVDIDDHHTIEDVAITLGSVMRNALGDKWGIGRYGFLLPMDESLAQVAIDLCGRSHCTVKAQFSRECIGDLSTELIPHFFISLSQSLQATLHISVEGNNTHHMIEAIFKCVGRALGQAIKRVDMEFPSTKGIL